MPDYILKKEALDLGLDKEQRLLSMRMYINRNNPDILQSLYNIWYEKYQEYKELWVEAKRLNASKYARTNRLWKRIYAMMTTGQCIFLTLTFNDETLNETDYDSRRRKVREYLKEQGEYYIANIDFGDENEREHYHAIILADKVNYKPWHKYGAIKGLKVHVSVDDAKRLSKYVSKMTNHAIKETTRQHRVIYGRNMHIFD